MLILFYDKIMWQKLIFQLPGLIPDTKNGKLSKIEILIYFSFKKKTGLKIIKVKN